MWHWVDRGFERLAGVDDRYPAVLFFATLLAYTLALLHQALSYSPAARLFPLIVGVPLALLIAAYILLVLLRDRIDLRAVGLFEGVGAVDAVSTERAVDRAARFRRESGMILWVVALVLLTWLFGNLLAVAVFVFAFIYVYEGDPVRALVASAATSGFIYLLFVLVLGAPLWRGVVPLLEVLT